MEIEVFLCYAHADEQWLNSIKKHLQPMLREKSITLWHDRDISAGKLWDQEIDEHISAAQVILLLVSPDFMDSDYCYSIEMRRALERNDHEDARVIPIILRSTDWQNTLLGKLQALPKDGKPISTWRFRDNAYVDIAKGLRKVILEIQTQGSTVKQVDSYNQENQNLEKANVHLSTIHTGESVEEALAKFRDEIRRQKESDDLLFEARKFASSLMEKKDLVKRAIDLWPPYKQREQRQLGIDIKSFE